MKFKEYIKQMDDAEFAAFLLHVNEEFNICSFCPEAEDGIFCDMPEKEKRNPHCTASMQALLEKDINDSVFDRFFCR